MSNLIFNDDNHTAILDGKPIGRVTTIIKDAGFGVDERFYADDFYCHRGTLVHRALHLLEKGTLDREYLDQQIEPYLQAWEKCKQDMQIVVEETEIPIYDKTYWYAGKADLKATMRVAGLGYRIPAIVDYKTGKPTEADALQIAAYAHPYRNNSPSRACVYLSNDGKYKMKFYTDHEDINIFLSCANIYNRKNRGRNGN